MDLRILEIASHTENNKVLENYTHKSKNKNPICGDEMEISLIVKDEVVKIKLEEIGKTIKPISNKEKITDNHLVNLMQFYELIEELKSL